MMTQERGLQKSGYLDVKQSSKVRGRKLKTWKRRWVVVHQMNDMASGTFAAKVNIFVDAETAKKSPSIKMVFILENVTKVQMAQSKTHPNAFEIVEVEPSLVFSGSTELETREWMKAFRQIFWPDDSDSDVFDVRIQQNDHSMRLNLSGKYKLRVTSSEVALQSDDGDIAINWNLSCLKRFYLDTEPNANQKRVLVIESGPKSDTGEGTFRFMSADAENILKTIRQCITEALSQKQKARQLKTHSVIENSSLRERAVSVSCSEKGFRTLLDNNKLPAVIEGKDDRSGSETSATSFTSTPPGSPLSQTSLSPPVSPLQHIPSTRTVSSPIQSVVIPEAEQQKPGMTKNASVPNMVMNTQQHVHSYVENPPMPDAVIKMRAQSFTSRGSSTSHDSGIMFLEGDAKGLQDKPRKSSTGEARWVSNSFDSAVSTGSNEETRRKVSDIEQPIIEEPPPTPIYQDIDDKSVSLKQNKSPDGKRRRRSTGDVGKENDYEELESYRKKHDKEQTTTQDLPPALPERPATLRLHKKNKDKSRNRFSALPSLFTGQKQKETEVIPVFNESRRCSSGNALDLQSSPNSISRSSSKDLYASIPDIDVPKYVGHRRSSSDFTATFMSHRDGRNNQTSENKMQGQDEIIDLFSPSVADWIIQGGHAAACSPTVSTPTEDLLGLASKDVAPTASVTDWTFMAASEVTSDLLADFNFQDPSPLQANSTQTWANFDVFDMWDNTNLQPKDINTSDLMTPNNESGGGPQENVYIDMANAKEKQEENGKPEVGAKLEANSKPEGTEVNKETKVESINQENKMNNTKIVNDHENKMSDAKPVDDTSKADAAHTVEDTHADEDAIYMPMSPS